MREEISIRTIKPNRAPSRASFLIYGTGIKNARNPFIINEYRLLIYGKRGFHLFAFPANRPHSPKPPVTASKNDPETPHSGARRAIPFANSLKINRKPELLEPPVSCRKQSTVTKINRKPFKVSRFPFSHSPNPPGTGLENDPETPQSGGRRAIPFANFAPTCTPCFPAPASRQ